MMATLGQFVDHSLQHIYDISNIYNFIEGTRYIFPINSEPILHAVMRFIKGINYLYA